VVQGSGTITSADGDISIIGTGGDSTGNNSYGIYVKDLISSTGTGAGRVRSR